MRKKLLSLALALVMCLSLMPSAFAVEGASVDKFTDVPADAWYREELAYAVYNGYISGTSATTFSPDGLVTRGQFVTILGRMLEIDADNGTTWFTDVPETAFYAPYVGWAASNRYVNGTSSTTFAPNNNITVEQMGTILANYISISGVVLTGTTPQEQYADANTISGWAKDNMELVRQYDLLPVDGKGNVSPRKAATRAEAAVSLVRLAQSAGWGTAPAEQVPTSDYSAEVAAKVESIHNELWSTGKITASMTEKEKAIAYFRWMCINCVYDDTWYVDTDLDIYDVEAELHSAYGPLILGRGVCDGLAEAYKVLLETEGISCEVLEETKPGHRYGHAWDIVMLDGESFKIDMTGAVSCTKLNGEFKQILFDHVVLQTFYPEEYQSSKKPMDGYNK